MRRNESQLPARKTMTALSSPLPGTQDMRSGPPMSSISLGQGRTDSVSTLESLVNGISPLGSLSGISRSGSTSQLNGSMHQRSGDKTVCEYCGVSYMTMSAMRSLQTKVKDQEERLNHLKEATVENTRMKETLGNIRKNHRKEITKRDEECQRWVARCTSVETEVESLKRDLKESQAKNADLAQKYAIASEDFKQQEEFISQLRSKLQSQGDKEAENNALINKNKNLEDNLQKLLEEIKSLRNDTTPVAAVVKNQSVNSTVNETALKAKLTEMTERCNRLTAENTLYQEELLAILQSQEKQELTTLSSHASTSVTGENTKPPTKMPSVVSVEVHDLKRENTILQSRLQTIAEEHSNCTDMHAFLRESIEKLKSDNVRLVEEMNGVKVKYEESLLKVENFQVVISGYQAERNRFMASYKDQQNKLEQLAAQNRAFHKSCDPKLIEQLRVNVGSLERQIHVMQQEKDRQQLEFEGKLAEVQREVIMEKEKVDSCLTHGLMEREEVEKRWQERWTRHHSKLTGQLEILKTNYEGSLKCSKEREEALRREIHHLQEKIGKTQNAWDEYKIRRNDELLQWKAKYEELEEEFHNTVKGKVDVEVMFQEKSQQLEELHEAVRQGCEERHDLQRRAEELERSIQEVACTSATSLTANSAVLIYPNQMENQTQIMNAQDCSLVDISSISSSVHDPAASVVWKQSQNYSPKKQQQQQHHEQKLTEQQSTKSGSFSSSHFESNNNNTNHVRQRPNSPFPVPGGKNSPQTFTVGLGKNIKSHSNGNFKEKSNSKNSSHKSSGAVVFSVAPPPNNSRKAHRQH